MLPKFRYDQTVPEGIPFNLQVAIGRVPGFDSEYIVGQNAVIAGQNALKSLWNNNSLETIPVAAHPLSLVSTSVQDNPAGTGAHQFFIYGLDNNFNLIEEWIAPNGTSIVVTQQSFRKVLACEVSQGNSNAGVITINQTVTNTLMGTINTFGVEARYGSFLIPQGYYGLLLDITAGVTPTTAAIRLQSINMTTGLSNGSDIIIPNSLTTGYTPSLVIPPVYPPTTFLQVTIEPADGATYSATCIIQLLLVKAEYVNPQLFNIQP